MNHRILLGVIGPFGLLAAASCGSSSGGTNGSNGNGDTNGLGDGSTSGDDDATPGSSGGGSSGGSDDGGGSSGGSDDSGASSGGGSEGGTDGSTTGDGGISATSADVPMLHKHINRDGLFVDSAFSTAALKGKTLKLDSTFDGTVSGNVYASPLYVANGPNGKGTFYVVTESNNVYALDETTGKSAIPSKSAGTAAAQTGVPGCESVNPLGITGTPAIDLATRTIVFDAAVGDANSLKDHFIRAWSIDDFSEKWSLDLSKVKDPVAGAFTPQIQHQHGAVLIQGGIAYVEYGGHNGDCDLQTNSGTIAYHGWVIGVPLNATTATALSLSKEWATPASRAGIWGASGPSSDGMSIFVATGDTGDGDPNGKTSAWKGGYSDVRFGPGPVFTPGTANFWHAVSDDSNGDDDLGGSAPLVVDAPTINPSKLLVQLGKDNHAYVVNRTTMGGEMSPVASLKVSTGELSNAPAWATETAPSKGTYVAMVSNHGAPAYNCPSGQSGNLAVIALSSTAQISVAWCADNQGCGSPSITSPDGTTDMLVWTVGSEGAGNASNELHAWALDSGDPVVMGSDLVPGVRHFSTPIFVHGRAFTAGDNRLFALKP